MIKGMDEEKQTDIWLVWSVGRYANGFPMIDLRAVCTSEESANLRKGIVEDWARRETRPFNGVILCESVNIEKRITNHAYGVCMTALSHLKEDTEALRGEEKP
uniref:Uncharacterized protein n=2 Tax=viral metagenome TaxID=1070528 RepID=A0A6M3JCE5_9ZZZZ